MQSDPAYVDDIPSPVGDLPRPGLLKAAKAARGALEADQPARAFNILDAAIVAYERNSDG